MNKKEQRTALVAKGQNILSAAKGAPTEAQLTELTQINDQITELTADIDRGEKGDALIRQLKGLDYPSDDDRTGKVLDLKSISGQLAKSRLGIESDVNVKALLAGGDSVARASFRDDPISLGRPLDQITDVLGIEGVQPMYSYLQQTTRDLNAAVVAPGDTKPTSELGLTLVEGKLKVVAHLSEAIHRFWVEDNQKLASWIEQELVYGLGVALADEILRGDGTSGHFTGFDTVIGTQSQSFESNVLITARHAINKLDLVGETPRGFVFHPSTWLECETMLLAGGGFALGGALPIEAATRKLFGVPVVVSTAVAEGKGYLVADGAASLLHAGDSVNAQPTISAEWGLVGDDFAKNAVRARVEGRFDLAVTRPAGIVLIDTEDTEG